jgi:hypothetical protein
MKIFISKKTALIYTHRVNKFTEMKEQSLVSVATLNETKTIF